MFKLGVCVFLSFVISIVTLACFDIYKIAADIRKIKNHIVQQPHERNLPIAVEDSVWRLWSNDSAVVCSDGDCTKVITFYYKR